MVDNAFAGCFGIYQDITERVESETKLRDASRSPDPGAGRGAGATSRASCNDNIGQRLAVLACQLADVQKTSRLRSSVPGRPAAGVEQAPRGDLRRYASPVAPAAPVAGGARRVDQGAGDLLRGFRTAERHPVDFQHDEGAGSAVHDHDLPIPSRPGSPRNAEKHSGATESTLKLARHLGRRSRCACRIRAAAFQRRDRERSGLGLMSMAERVRSVGGELSIQPDINRGTARRGGPFRCHEAPRSCNYRWTGGTSAPTSDWPKSNSDWNDEHTARTMLTRAGQAGVKCLRNHGRLFFMVRSTSATQ